jgi:hypothetical protein
LSTTSSKEDFAATFTIAVHGGLDKVLGRSGTEAVLVHIKMTGNLPDSEEFHKKLIALFGAEGTLSLERAIVKELAMKLKWSLDPTKIENTFDFNATMRMIKKDVKTHSH